MACFSCIWQSMINCYLSYDYNVTHDRAVRAFFRGLPEPKQLIRLPYYEPSEVAVVFGVGKKAISTSLARGKVIAQQRKNNLGVIVLETGYLNRGDGENHHYAAGWNGLNGRADFKNHDMPGDRAKLLGVELKHYREKGTHIVLCGQVPWDASVQHTDHRVWIAATARGLTKYSNRPVVFRPHPKVKSLPVEGVGFSKLSLAEDMIGAHAVVTFNSNSAVEALVAGYPVFADDPGSMVWGVCNKSIIDVENPKYPERRQWLDNLCYAQWTLDEMRQGKAWEHLR